jgi:lipoyl synthase
MNELKRKPDWLRIKLPATNEYSYIKTHLKKYNLHTICESGSCPNQGECWAAGTATFMILGNVCTRSCRFCNVETGKPTEADCEEPEKIAEAVKALKLKHCVITSVTRDDLKDGGAEIWAETIRAVKRKNPATTIETLIPDFKGIKEDILKVIDAKPDIISHNLETVRRLTKELRVYAKYDTSLSVIKIISESGIISKSGIMVGIGETEDEVYETMDDLLKAGCKIFTIGQYLQPAKDNLEVKEYIKPEIFEKYRQTGLVKGFEYVESSPLTRSSFHSSEQLGKILGTNSVGSLRSEV